MESWNKGGGSIHVVWNKQIIKHCDKKTPVGIADNITVHEIVKQGTIFCQKLCSVATKICMA